MRATRLTDVSYAAFVDQQVQWAEQYHMDIILDLHWSDQGNYSVGAACLKNSGNCQQDMADAHSVVFWQQVAAKYKNDPQVIFELYNEPKIGGYAPPASARDTWLNGGQSSVSPFTELIFIEASFASTKTKRTILGPGPWTPA
jgi:aryl-phospho-beta-D-glucosidase BglC (GH1 family)